MTNNKIKSARGISLVSLVIATIVLITLANVIIYNVKDNLKVGNLKGMQNDISNLRDKISSYYAQNGKIPASITYTNMNHIRTAGVISDAVDTGNFLVIDLSALENLTLNYGKDYEKIKGLENLTTQDAEKYTDIYIINETSHNVFYVAGITIDNETYYTDYTSSDIDKASVDLRYKEGVKIPDNFYYVEGTKDTGIVIRNSNNTENYVWKQQNQKIAEIPNNVEIDIANREAFIKSVNAYQGYYQNTSNQTVMYLAVDNWSPTYDKEGIYKDKNGNTAYIPAGFQVSETPGENTIDEGLVVKDGHNNQWVWIEVPKTIYVTATSSEDYEKIEADMQTYVSDYRDTTYLDIWHSKEQHGFASSDEYNNWKHAMLKSVYEKGGFYIGRYEVGTNTVRASNLATETTPIIQPYAYPYNYITSKQAQTLAESFATEGSTSSLMFGIQWDLILKFIEVKEGKTKNELITDSTTWGNYPNAVFNITQGRYANNPSTASSWKAVSLTYNKLRENSILMTTGVTQRNSVLNIFDLAGNVTEFTLEYGAIADTPCSGRGGNFATNTVDMCSAVNRELVDTTYADAFYGFRPALY